MITILTIFAISMKAQIVSDVVISTQSVKLYIPVNQRNPMVRSSIKSPITLKYSYSKSTSPAISEFSVDNLVLEGIMSNPNFKEALLRDKITGEMYIVRYGRIYTLNRRLIEGYSVEIVGKGVIVYDKKKGSRKELIIAEGGQI